MKSMLLVAAALVLVFSGLAWTAEGPGPEPADETIHRLEAEVRMLRATVASLVKENAALKAENAALRSGDAVPTETPAAPPAKPPAPVQPIAFEKQEDFVIGAIGRFPYGVRIEQILGPQEMLISINVQMGKHEETIGPLRLEERLIKRLPTRTVYTFERWQFWIQEVSTTGLVDGQGRKLDQVFVVRGTRAFETTDGGTKTVFVLAPAERTEKGKGS